MAKDQAGRDNAAAEGIRHQEIGDVKNPMQILFREKAFRKGFK
jgi:hypothetical protein